MGELAEHALSYAGLGLEIFPVAQDKRPLVSQHEATTDLDVIERWWSRWPSALIGHRIAPDVLLLDVDPRHNGHETWKALRSEIGPHDDAGRPLLIQTRTHLSGRGDGGGHIWFRRPAGRLTVTRLDAWAKEHGLGAEITGGGRWSSGIDLLRYEHRYTILPPSPHPDTGKPYQWAPGRGLTTEPAELPAFLAEMLTQQAASTPKPTGPAWRDADSIADWFSANHTWADVLEPRGWTLANGSGDDDGSQWRHPGASTSVSATVRHGNLFVYSTNTPFEPTEPDEPHGYTRFAAWSVLEHAGDQRAAGRSARERKRGITGGTSPTKVGQDEPTDTSGTREADAGAERSLQKVDLAALESFWTLRPQLTQIRDFARSRRCSPWAMLGVVLARVAAATPPFVTLPPLVGSHMSLNLYVVLVGGSGAGKDAAISAGRYCVDLSAGVEFRQIGLGSGEGILDQYVTYKPPDPKTDEAARIEQHTESVLFVNPEIETVDALKGRTSSTLMPMLRDAWMGSGLGFAYANRERRLYVNEHAYRLCLILGSQPTSAGVLLDDKAVGTPQRFVWLPVHDPSAPDEPPPGPEIPGWRLPHWSVAYGGKVALKLCDEAAEAIDNARLARLRGDAENAIDGHALACREKVAALLAILAGRSEVNVEDWSMAGIVQTVSDRTRDGAAELIDWESRRSNRARGVAAGERQVIVTDVVDDAEEEAVQRVCRLLSEHLSEEWVTGAKLANALPGRERKRFIGAVERMEAAGMIESEQYHRGERTLTKYRKVRGHADSVRD